MVEDDSLKEKIDSLEFALEAISEKVKNLSATVCFFDEGIIKAKGQTQEALLHIQSDIAILPRVDDLIFVEYRHFKVNRIIFSFSEEKKTKNQLIHVFCELV